MRLFRYSTKRDDGRGCRNARYLTTGCFRTVAAWSSPINRKRAHPRTNRRRPELALRVRATPLALKSAYASPDFCDQMRRNGADMPVGVSCPRSSFDSKPTTIREHTYSSNGYLFKPPYSENDD